MTGPDEDEYVHTARGEISIAEMREHASLWHGGQGSALYAFCSSGTVTAGLSWEAGDALRRADNMGQAISKEEKDRTVWVLGALARWAEGQEAQLEQPAPSPPRAR